MSAEPDHLDQLLAQLNSGDRAATEQVFRTYEPYLRILVRRELRAELRTKFDSSDVVQSVWADLLEGIQGRGWRFADRAHLQAFLVRLSKNRFIDLCRKHGPALAHEKPLADHALAETFAGDAPRPSEVAQGNELWERILALCPPNHRELVQMKLKGLTVDEIAGRVGLHPNSVRRILVELAQRVDAANGRSGPFAGLL
ncbi:MAG: RNA polymerase sigma factor [Isosphaeraceae bacterium]|nr:RNA polymerase sigma factor [Isosphaeraceae bacterium]